MWQKIKSFVQKEVVLCAALALAAGSAFFIPPDRAYADYIDFRTLAILFCLMCVMAGLQKMGVFQLVAEGLLGRVRGSTQMVLILVMLCFFFSMLITNDVALITFVPFTFTVGKLLGGESCRRMALPVVALQTVAANLGSMLTPIGNPQNLYLYGLSGMGTGDFILLMLPYTVLAFLLLAGCCVAFGRYLGGGRSSNGDGGRRNEEGGHTAGFDGKKSFLVVYLVLFGLCLLTVAHIISIWLTLALVAASVLIMDRRVFARVDYCLLLTFVGFFVFIGNMGRVPAFAGMLQGLVAGNEVFVSIAASQCISNVPAALLLSGFTDDIPGLIVGTNLGGLGTLIASMASLISYKYVAAEVQKSGMQGGKGKYFWYFTAVNFVFLAVLAILYLYIG